MDNIIKLCQQLYRSSQEIYSEMLSKKADVFLDGSYLESLGKKLENLQNTHWVLKELGVDTLIFSVSNDTIASDVKQTAGNLIDLIGQTLSAGSFSKYQKYGVLAAYDDREIDYFTNEMDGYVRAACYLLLDVAAENSTFFQNVFHLTAADIPPLQDLDKESLRDYRDRFLRSAVCKSGCSVENSEHEAVIKTVATAQSPWITPANEQPKTEEDNKPQALILPPSSIVVANQSEKPTVAQIDTAKPAELKHFFEAIGKASTFRSIPATKGDEKHVPTAKQSDSATQNEDANKTAGYIIPRKKEVQKKRISAASPIKSNAGREDVPLGKLVRDGVMLRQNWKSADTKSEGTVDTLCWQVLFRDEFPLARELAVTFRDIPNAVKYDEPTLIDLVGFGMFFAVPNDAAIVQFHSCQQLGRCGLSNAELLTVSLSTLLMAHFSPTVQMKSERLPEILQGWRDWLEQSNKERYIFNASATIEVFRQYQLRLNKIQRILQMAEEKIQGIRNTQHNFVSADNAMKALIAPDNLIGNLYDRMKLYPSEFQAFGIVKSEISILLKELKSSEPFRKSAGRVTRNDPWTHKYAEKVLDEADSLTRFASAPIQGKVRQDCAGDIADFLQIVDQWMTVLSERCEFNKYDPISAFMEESRAHYLDLKPELDQLIEQQSEGMERLALLRFRSAADWLMGETEDFSCHDYNESALRLCYIPELHVSRNEESGHYRLTLSDPNARIDILTRLASISQMDVFSCLRQYEEQKMFSGAELPLRLLEKEPEKKREEALKQYRDSLARSVKALKNSLGEMQSTLDRISLYAYAFEGEYERLCSTIQQTEYLLSQDVMEKNITQLIRAGEKCGEDVKRLDQKLMDRLREEAKGWSTSKRSEYEKLLNDGRYADAVAWSLFPVNMDVASSDFKNVSIVEKFFNKAEYAKRETALLGTGGSLDKFIERFVSAMKRGESWSGFDFDYATGGQATKRKELLDTWFLKVRRRAVDLLERQNPADYATMIQLKADLKTVLAGLGWKGCEIKGITVQRMPEPHLHFIMTYDMPYTREHCPLPLFGSESSHEVRLLCVAGKHFNADDKLRNLFEKYGGSGKAIIIIFFGVLTYTRRAWLRKTMIKERLPYLVLDNLAFLSLCGSKYTELLPYLYKLTAPLSAQRLFTTRGSSVPPEMFYGRTDEKNALGIYGDARLVYGGRQLGKTVLLKSIQNDEHNPKVEHYVLYFELSRDPIEKGKAEEVLLSKIGPRMGQEVFGRKITYQTLSEVMNEIQTWIKQDNKRRLLLLLDETDEFMISDQKDHWRVINLLNQTMNEAGKQFKVVFAGLNNVLRMTRDKNAAVAHFGKAVNIGPFLGDEAFEAIKLIKEPLKLMGYRIDYELIIRILEETNYYPSLIQVFCSELVNYLQKTMSANKRGFESPEADILEDIKPSDIEAVLNKSDLKEQIRTRFMWTLELDSRYEVIALNVALYAHLLSDDYQDNFVNGYSLSWLLEKAQRCASLFGGGAPNRRYSRFVWRVSRTGHPAPRH